MRVLNVRRSELNVIGWRDGRNGGWRCGGGKTHQQARTVFLRSMRPRATEFGRVPPGPHISYSKISPAPLGPGMSAWAGLRLISGFVGCQANNRGFDRYLGVGIAGPPRLTQPGGDGGSRPPRSDRPGRGSAFTGP